MEGWRQAAFAGAVLTYGALGAPAPPGLRIQEMLVLAGLLAFAGLRGPLLLASGLALLRRRAPMPLSFSLASLVLVSLLWLGTLRGLWNGWAVTDMVRDILPFLFLALPVLLAPGLSRLSPASANRLADWVAAGGVLFALRWWLDAGMAVSALGSTALGEGRDYLLNSALVPFAAVWLVLRVFSPCERTGRGRWRLLLFGLRAAGGLFCLLALAATVHRAALGLCLLAILVGVARPLADRPFLLATLGCGLVLLVLVAGGPLSGIYALAAAKTENVGLNNRVGELLAVLDQVGRDPVALLLGDGWGALLSNPAVGNWRVSYTHNASSYFLLKCGVPGLLGMALYAGLLAGLAARAARTRPMLLIAALPSLLVGGFLHTSFKYLCFGIISSLVVSQCNNTLYKGNDGELFLAIGDD